MDRMEKYLYHQIHPLKLAVDIGTALFALILLWRHLLLEGIVIAIVPPPIASGLLIEYANLERYKESALGRYIAKHMTRKIEGVRLLGFLIMAIGAWYQVILLLIVGLMVVLVGWANGLILRRQAA